MIKKVQNLKNEILEYRVVDSTSLGELVEAINQKLSTLEGWEPFGQLYVTMNGRYLQPIVRRETVVHTVEVEENDDNDDEEEDTFGL